MIACLPKTIRRIFKTICCLVFIAQSANKAAVLHAQKSTNLMTDLIIFSFDRPMQLYALLESSEHYLTGIENTFVIYRSSNERFAKSYLSVKERFPGITYLKQGANPAVDFKLLVMQALNGGASSYIIFSVDDIIVKNYADLRLCTAALEQSGAYGFYLRLAPHLDYSYAEHQLQPLPPLKKVHDEILSWVFQEGKFDWHYPNTVDMTIYRKSDVCENFERFFFTNPNSLEGIWASQGYKVMGRKGLCFTQSIVVNIPINLVQDVCQNRCENSWSTEKLLENFEQGQKINFMDLKRMQNKSCHIEYEIQFVGQ
jgi:hypothetical protein